VELVQDGHARRRRIVTRVEDKQRNPFDCPRDLLDDEHGVLFLIQCEALRDSDGDVRFHPRLPAGWSRLRFRVQVREQLVEVDITHSATIYRLLEGQSLQIEHFGEQLRLTPGRPLFIPAPAGPAGGLPQDLPHAA
jgi:hypothetical protein